MPAPVPVGHSGAGLLMPAIARAAYFLFHDCDLADVRAGLQSLRLFYPASAYREVHELPRLPSTYVLPRDDRTLRPSWMRRAARERLGVEAIEVDGGHCPQTSRPETLAAVLGAAWSGPA
ncbi:alpha/beta fold hydrolase [Saccharothrix isguenensis]